MSGAKREGSDASRLLTPKWMDAPAGTRIPAPWQHGGRRDAALRRSATSEETLDGGANPSPLTRMRFC